MIIDAHSHVGWNKIESGEDLIGNMDTYGIDQSIVHTWELQPSEIDDYDKATLSNSKGIRIGEVLRACSIFRDRLFPFYCPDPRKKNASLKIEESVFKHNIRGVGEFKFPVVLTSPECKRFFEVARANLLPILIHLEKPGLTYDNGGQNSYWSGGDFKEMIRVVRAFPEVQFIGHGPEVWRAIECRYMDRPELFPKGKIHNFCGDVFALVETENNFHLDISGYSGLNALYRMGELAPEFFNQYMDQIVFGRDNFTCVHQEFIDKLNLDPEVIRKIYHENITKLIGLEC